MDFKKTNPAVIKSMFLQMDKQTFKVNMDLLYNELLTVKQTPITSNYRYALSNLYRWCFAVYQQKFK